MDSIAEASKGGAAENVRLRDGILAASGYGLKIYVERGHLVVHQGVGRDRSTLRINRATGQLKRLVVVGHSGFVTLEALRWVKDVGAAFIQIDRDSEVVAMSAGDAQSSARHLRRAQVLAADSNAGIVLLQELLKAKLIGQAKLAARLIDYRPPKVGRDRRNDDVQGMILARVADIEASTNIQHLRLAESHAGRTYWQLWAYVKPRFDPSWEIPEHWRRAGPRTSPLDRKRAKRALTPIHACLNYLYAILESEATIALQRMGFDPTLGLMHADKRYRPSLSSDLMEPVRVAADEYLLDLIEDRTLCRGDMVETRQGICRLGIPSTARLAEAAPTLQRAVAPYAEWLAKATLGDASHPTPLTRRKHRAALSAQGLETVQPVGVPIGQ